MLHIHLSYIPSKLLCECVCDFSDSNCTKKTFVIQIVMSGKTGLVASAWLHTLLAAAASLFLQWSTYIAWVARVLVHSSTCLYCVSQCGCPLDARLYCSAQHVERPFLLGTLFYKLPFEQNRARTLTDKNSYMCYWLYGRWI